jgi:hypothetical protein
MVSRGGFDADGADESVEIVDDAVIEAIELGSLVWVEAAVAGHGVEEAGRERGVDALEEFQEDETDRVSLREKLISAGMRELGDEPR